MKTKVEILDRIDTISNTLEGIEISITNAKNKQVTEYPSKIEAAVLEDWQIQATKLFLEKSTLEWVLSNG